MTRTAEATLQRAATRRSDVMHAETVQCRGGGTVKEARPGPGWSHEATKPQRMPNRAPQLSSKPVFLEVCEPRALFYFALPQARGNLCTSVDCHGRSSQLEVEAWCPSELEKVG